MFAYSENSAQSRSDFSAVPLASLPTSERYYAVQCQPNRERTAAHHLGNQDIFSFLPLREKTRRHARRIETVRVPFFPGYLFVSLDLTRDRWRSVSGTIGVVRLVMQGDRPAPVPFGVVESLKDACDSNKVIRWKSALTPGQAVRVVKGPLADLLGELVNMTESGRLRVLLNIMGRQAPVVLSEEHVVGADSLL